jgi:hypothetical protein
MTCAPVALFVYNRPWHTRQTIDALLANAEASETPLYVFSDAEKNASASKEVTAVRSYLREITGFKSVAIIERESNFGLARSIIDGVSALCEQYGRVIVMEDDLVTSPYFLKYMNEGLEKYQDDQRVISIHGYVYPVKQVLPETFFLKGADCWGWATWKRGWGLFEPDGQKLQNELERSKLCRQFDFDGSYPYTRMLQNQIAGKNNSWAIRWYASAFLQDKLTLYPGRSLVHNIGLDGSGTHCSETEGYAGKLANYPISIETVAVVEDSLARQAIVNFHKQTRPSLHMKVANKLLSKIQKLRTIWHDKSI